MASISSANAVFQLAINGLFVIPQQLQGFTATDMFDMASSSSVEATKGMDGKLSGGFKPPDYIQTITLQSDSESVTLFEVWFQAMSAARDVFFANGVVHFGSIRRGYTLVNGLLTGYDSMPAAGTTLKQRKFLITWEDCIGAPL